MATTHMVVAKKMRNLIYKGGLFVLIFAFLFLSFSSLAVAVDYGSGLYGDALYSASSSAGGGGGGGSPNKCPSGTTGTYPNCTSSICPVGTLFNTTTGQPCTTTYSNTCPVGTLFNTVTGQPCTTTYSNTCPVGTLFNTVTGQLCTSFSSASSVSLTPSLTPTLSRTLKFTIPRMTGNDVKELQTYLNNHGYNCGIADGIFGLKTKGVVILFQKANNLKADGVVGPLTKAKLK